MIRSIVLYGSKTVTKCEEKSLREWETKILKKVFGAICKNKKWRIRMNIEIYDCYKKNKENSITGPCGENGTK